MSRSLLESLSDLASPSVVAKVASLFGESEGAIAKGLGAAFPAILSGIATKSSNADFATRLFQLVTDKTNDGSALTNVAGSLLGGSGHSSPLANLGATLLSSVFGDKANGLVMALGEFAGLKGSSASSLLSLAAPLVMGVLGNKVRTEGLSASGLGELLAGQKNSFASQAPAVLANFLGAPSAAAPASSAAGTNWLVPVFLLGGLGLLWWLVNGPKDTAEKQEASAPAAHAAATQAPASETHRTTEASEATTTEMPPADATPAATSPWGDLGAFAERALPGGAKLNLPAKGVENQLLAFIEDSSKAVNKDTWFNFDRLLFDTGKSTLRPESLEQIKNTAEILKAFPQVALKIGGYTDNQGKAESNLKLSQARAEAVTKELATLGIAASRLEAEGYGDQHPVADNATPEGRQQNRRIAMRVTKK